MNIFPFLLGYFFQENKGHSIVKRAGPIGPKNICVTECTGEAGEWTNYDGNEVDMGVKLDGNAFLLNTFLHELIITIHYKII